MIELSLAALEAMAGERMGERVCTENEEGGEWVKWEGKR